MQMHIFLFYTSSFVIWSILNKIWQRMIVISSNTMRTSWKHNSEKVCEHNFLKPNLKPNLVKIEWNRRMKLKILDALMKVSICGKEVEAMNWPSIFDMWSVVKHCKMFELDVNLMRLE